jgi:Gas vesicle synthesis protein GvpL/GvpF
VIYVYAIGDAATLPPEPAGRGLGGARLHVLARDGLAAVLSRHRTLRPEPSPALLWAHEAVVERLMAAGTVLPLRFGTVLDGDDALAATLAERRDDLAAGLERVRGRVELGVRVLGSPPQARPTGAQSGRAYLMARRDAHRRAEREAAEVHAPLAAQAHDARLRAPAPPPAILAAAYLVDRSAVAAFRARVGALAAARADVAIACTGPWPPYSFVPEGRP